MARSISAARKLPRGTRNRRHPPPPISSGRHEGVDIRKILWLSLLLVAFPPPDARAERLPIKTYTTADGLAHNTINRIVRDSRGFLWFCTAGGLSRFDGYAFTNFGTEHGLPTANVTDLLETRGGAYWIGTDGGLVHFDPKGVPLFTVVTQTGVDRRARAITVLRETRDGTLWVGTRDGLYRLEQGSGQGSLRQIEIRIPREYPEQRQIADILEDRYGTLWIAAFSGLYRRWPDGSAERYTRRDGLPHDYLHDLLEDHEGRLWVGTRLEGFFRVGYDTSHRAPVVDVKFTYPAELPTSWVSQLFETSARRFWIATPRGLVEFLPGSARQGKQFPAYTARNGLTDHNLTALAEDLGGNLWLGTLAGAMKVARDGFSSHGQADGIQSVNTIFEDRSGHLCFRGGVLGDARTSFFEGATLDPLRGDAPIIHSRLGCFDGEQRFDWFKPRAVSDMGWVGERVVLQSRSGEWWIGSGEGLYRFPSGTNLATLKTARPVVLYTTKDGLAAVQVFRLFEDSQGNVWISTTSPATAGLARWIRAEDRIRDLSAAPGLASLKDDWPARSFAEDRAGSVWLGFDSELARYKNGAFKIFTAADGLPRGKIRNIHTDRSGRLWLASSESGLVRVDDPAAQQPDFRVYTTAHRLSGSNAEVITEDLAGNIYVGGGHGVDRLEPETGRVKHFTTSEGLRPGTIRVAFRDRYGALWFGSDSGLARLVPVPDKPPAAPLVLISGLHVRGVPQLVSALGESRMSFPDFAPDRNQLQIDFVGLSFSPGDVLRYQYRLDGSDAEWGALGQQRTVTYASIAPGSYTFMVRAVNSDGIASTDPASITFTVLRPVWQRSWFLMLVALAGVLAVYAVYRYRVARLLELANMRTRIATDLHDDIGANLTRIALLSETARHGGSDNGPLASIAHIARESVSSMSDIVWAVNPKRESLMDLIRRMRQHADEVFTQRDIELHFNAPGAADGIKLGMGVRRDLLLVFKEAVNNAARHSRCSVVRIDLRMQGSRLLLTVADNGVGFDTSVEYQGQGIVSLRRRGTTLKGIVDVVSGGTGTTVTASIPV